MTEHRIIQGDVLAGLRGVIEQLHREGILMEVSHGKYMVI